MADHCTTGYCSPAPKCANSGPNLAVQIAKKAGEVAMGCGGADAR
jgi:hypothetical protein